MRRILILGGLLICGWLISSLQSAHAADVAPPVTSALDTVGAATADAPATHARRDADHPAGGAHGRSGPRHAAAVTEPSSVHPAGAVSTRSATQPAHVASAGVVRGVVPGARQAVHRAPAVTGTISPGTQARTSTQSVGATAPREIRLSGPTELPVSALAPARAHQAAPVSAAAAHAPAAPDLPAAIDSPALNPRAAPSAPPTAPGMLPALTPAAAPPHPPPLLGLSPPLDALLGAGRGAASAPAPDSAALDPMPVFGAPAGLLGPLSDATALDPPVFDDPVGLLGPATDVLGSVSVIIQRPIYTVGALVAGPAAVLTAPLDNVLTTTLGTNVLGALTAPLSGMLAQLGQLAPLATQLIPQAGLLRPVAGLLAPTDGIGPPVGLLGDIPIGPLPPPVSSSVAGPAGDPGGDASSIGGSWPTAAVPASSGQVDTGGSGQQQMAQAPSTPADQPPLGAGPRGSSSRVLRGQCPQPPRSPNVSRAHMSGQTTGPFSPGDSNVPLSGTSNRALPTSSQNDGNGDTPHSWQACVPETFTPVRIVAPPAVRTAADEPAYSPD